MRRLAAIWRDAWRAATRSSSWRPGLPVCAEQVETVMARVSGHPDAGMAVTGRAGLPEFGGPPGGRAWEGRAARLRMPWLAVGRHARRLRRRPAQPGGAVLMAEVTPSGSGGPIGLTGPAVDGGLEIRGGLGGITFQLEELMGGAGKLDDLAEELADVEVRSPPHPGRTGGLPERRAPTGTEACCVSARRGGASRPSA